MTDAEMLEIAMRQSAVDMSCSASDFLKDENVVVISREQPGARKYLSLPFLCDLTYYGRNVVASVGEDFVQPVREYIDSYQAAHLFETPNLHVLNELAEQHGGQVCFMAEYFLPDMSALKPLDCPYALRIMGPEDFRELYRPEWSNALCEKRKELDVLGVGAFDEAGRLVGLAGCSADCASMWQIGIDVLPEARRKGVASALTSRLALEILERGKVPYYCAAWSNIPSVRNAIRAGFRPAWVELTVKSREFTEEMNRVAAP